MTSLLSVQSVDVKLAGRQILRDISVDVEPGEVFTLVGPNGAGKSTLLGVLAGDIRPDSGSVLLRGAPIRLSRPKDLARERAMLLQSNQVSFPFSVGHVVSMGRNPWAGTDRADADEEVTAWAMEHVDVASLRHRRFSELSGGERARVSLARVLAQDTEIVLLDEPTAALDLHHQDRVMRLIRELSSMGRAVVVVVHDLSLAAAFADRVGLLVDGQLVTFGAVSEVMTPELLSDAYDVPIHVMSGPDGTPLIVPKRRRD